MQPEAAGRQPLFAVRRLGHVNLFVADIDRSVSFYQDVIGLGVAWRRSNMRTGFLSNGNSHHDIGLIDLHGPLGETPTPALNHLAFELETQVDLVDGYRRGLSSGFDFTAMYDHEISHSLYYKNPDGDLIEVYADTDVNWQERLVNPIKPSLDKWVPGATPPSTRPHYTQNPVFQRHDHAIFHATKVTHAVLMVADVAATAEHYQRVLGLRPVWRRGDGRAVSLGGSCGARDVTLVEADGRCGRGLHHFGFAAWSEADLKASVGRAKRDGLAIESEIDSEWRHSVMLKDPDGFVVQLYADRKPLDIEMGLPSEMMIHLV
ncbi:MAG: VOC family protein [Alphaproteobacteria bacterium]